MPTKKVRKYLVNSVLIAIGSLLGFSIYNATILAANVGNPACISKITGFMESDLNGRWTTPKIGASGWQGQWIFRIKNGKGIADYQVKDNDAKRPLKYVQAALITPGRSDFFITLTEKGHAPFVVRMSIVNKKRLLANVKGDYYHFDKQ